MVFSHFWDVVINPVHIENYNVIAGNDPQHGSDIH